MESNRPFPETLTHLMDMQEISGRQVALRADMSRVAINEMKRGGLKPSMRAITSIASALGIRPETFAEYRLGVAREELDPGAVGLSTALTNLARFKGRPAGGAEPAPHSPASTAGVSRRRRDAGEGQAASS